MKTKTITVIEAAMVLFAVFILTGSGYSNIELPNPHNEINNELPCLDCHDTYRDEVDEHAFVTGVTEICEDCHELGDLGRTHPYDVDPDRSHIPDLRVPDELPLADGMITCGSCHDPHMAYLQTVRLFSNQPAEEGFSTAYYQSFYTRMVDPSQGRNLLCTACHSQY